MFLFKEYCSREYFEPHCSNNEIIIMKEAQYGRMQLGRCVDEDLGYLGCGISVRNYFDEVCSGKQQCKVDIYRDIPSTQGCRKGLERYLEASYQCVSGKIDYTCCNAISCYCFIHM